jgi:ribonuclease HII
MGENNLALQSLTCKCLDVAYYNKQVSLVKNKSKVLFSAIAELMYQIIKDSTDQKIHFLVDHQGGRTHYAGELLKLFAPDDITILAESAELSSYKLEFDKKCVNMTFLVKADLNHFAPALASMTSKYLREIMIHKLNTHFAGLDSTIKPTAGYWSDGKRFLSDLETKLAHIKIDKNILVRSR